MIIMLTLIMIVRFHLDGQFIWHFAKVYSLQFVIHDYDIRMRVGKALYEYAYTVPCAVDVVWEGVLCDYLRYLVRNFRGKLSPPKFTPGCKRTQVVQKQKGKTKQGKALRKILLKYFMEEKPYN